MRFRVAPVKNITRLAQAADALTTRGPGIPGMGIVHGPTGYGKTTALGWLRTRTDGIYIRALALWTPSSMLEALAKEVGVEPYRQLARTLGLIIDELRTDPRPVMIDEADYVVETKKMVETLRDLHDQSRVPVILIGMQGFEKRVKRWEQLAGRISEKVPFEPADFQDLSVLARELCEVEIAPDLLEALHLKARGSVRLSVIGMSRIENFAKVKGLETVSLDDWKGDFFFGEAPRRN